MTPEQIQLVRSTWTQVQPIRTQAAELFYGRLFAIAPEVQPMFKRDMAAQGNKLMAALNTLVLSLGRMEQMLPLARELAIRHVAWGVQPAHYTLVGEALLWALREGLADSGTPAAIAAWGAAYSELSGAMKAAAYPSITDDTRLPATSVPAPSAG